MPPEKPQWAELFTEVVTSGLCTGCSACVVVCPYDVLGYNDKDGVYRPFHVDADGGPDNCTHGLKGCTLCTRACPRFRTWEPEIETHLFGRPREEDEVAGISRRTVLARATDASVQGTGQDGGLVSALLIWAFEHELIDAALVSGLEGDGSTWKAVPQVARSKEDVLATAGSRYTYSANPLAYAEAEVLQDREALAERGLDRTRNHLTARVGHEALHGGDLTDLRGVTTRTRSRPSCGSGCRAGRSWRGRWRHRPPCSRWSRSRSPAGGARRRR